MKIKICVLLTVLLLVPLVSGLCEETMFLNGVDLNSGQIHYELTDNVFLLESNCFDKNIVVYSAFIKNQSDVLFIITPSQISLLNYSLSEFFQEGIKVNFTDDESLEFFYKLGDSYFLTKIIQDGKNINFYYSENNLILIDVNNGEKVSFNYDLNSDNLQQVSYSFNNSIYLEKIFLYENNNLVSIKTNLPLNKDYYFTNLTRGENYIYFNFDNIFNKTFDYSNNKISQINDKIFVGENRESSKITISYLNNRTIVRNDSGNEFIFIRPISSVPFPIPCTDNDRIGDPYFSTFTPESTYVASSVEYNGQTYSDTCEGANSLREYYCERDWVRWDIWNVFERYSTSTVVDCPLGCENGACKTEFSSLFAGGIGTLEYPYQIASWNNLNNVRTNLNAHYILTADLSSSDLDYVGLGDDWQPIWKAGYCLNYPALTSQSSCENEGNIWVNPLYFAGTFDGNNKVISNLIINLSSANYVGLFGVIGAGGLIKNLGLEDVNILGSMSVGSIAGVNYGGISQCYVSGIVNATSHYVGGIVGGIDGANGNILDSYSTVNVYGNNVGGIIGINYGGQVKNCYSTGLALGNGNNGGITSHNYGGSILNSYSTGNVFGEGYVGGVVGYSYESSTNNVYFYNNRASGSGGCSGCSDSITKASSINDFYNISYAVYNGWNISLSSTNINEGYPYLGWQAGNNSSVWLIYTSQIPIGEGIEDSTNSVTSNNNQIIIANDNININLNNEAHNLKVNSIDSTGVIITISSTPQTSALKIGEEKKFELTGDNYYDLSVKLNSVINNKANLTWNKIHEEIPASDKIDNSKTTESIENKTLPAIEKNQPLENPVAKQDYTLIWIISIILMLIVIILVVFIILKKKHVFVSSGGENEDYFNKARKFVFESRKAGYSEEQIRGGFKNKGWKKEHIDKVFR